MPKLLTYKKYKPCIKCGSNDIKDEWLGTSVAVRKLQHFSSSHRMGDERQRQQLIPNEIEYSEESERNYFYENERIIRKCNNCNFSWYEKPIQLGVPNEFKENEGE